MYTPANILRKNAGSLGQHANLQPANVPIQLGCARRCTSGTACPGVPVWVRLHLTYSSNAPHHAAGLLLQLHVLLENTAVTFAFHIIWHADAALASWGLASLGSHAAVDSHLLPAGIKTQHAGQLQAFALNRRSG